MATSKQNATITASRGFVNGPNRQLAQNVMGPCEVKPMEEAGANGRGLNKWWRSAVLNVHNEYMKQEDLITQ